MNKTNLKLSLLGFLTIYKVKYDDENSGKCKLAVTMKHIYNNFVVKWFRVIFFSDRLYNVQHQNEYIYIYILEIDLRQFRLQLNNFICFRIEKNDFPQYCIQCF